MQLADGGTKTLDVARAIVAVGVTGNVEDVGLETTRVLVVPSTYEGMPLVILEAMEAGCSVVASAVSGIPEVVVDGETGWLVPPEDAAALADALEAAAGDEGETRRRGERGRARLEELYRPRAVAEVWLERVEREVPR